MEALKMERQMDNWNDDRLDALSRGMDERFNKVDERFNKVDQRFEQVDKRFEQVDKRFDKVDERFEQVDKRFEQVDKRFATVATKEEMGEVRGELRHLNDRFDRLLHALTVGGISFGITMLATLAGLIATQV